MLTNKKYIQIAGAAFQGVLEGEDFSFYFSGHNAPSLAELLPGQSLRRIPMPIKRALHTASLALHFAGMPPVFNEEKSGRCGLFIASSHGAVLSSFQFNDSILDDGPQLASPTAFSYSVNNIFSGVVSNILNIQGPSLGISQFGLSLPGAFAAAWAAINDEKIDYALVGQVEENSPLLQAAYHSFQADLAPNSQGEAFFYLQRITLPAGVLLDKPEWKMPNGEQKTLGLFLRSGLLNNPLLASGAQKRFCDNCDNMHAHPLGMAKDMSIALNLLSSGFGAEGHGSKRLNRIICQTKDPITKGFASIGLMCGA